LLPGCCVGVSQRRGSLPGVYHMLVLTRRVGEEIVIDDTIRMVVLGIRGNQIRLGLTAPASVHIVRSELLVDAGKSPGPRHARPARAKDRCLAGPSLADRSCNYTA
jgi:carbon storage regulator